jgi:dTDP-4-amino-4,6-dideoxygalactose transaminase
MIPISKPIIGEEEKLAVLHVLGTGMLAQGPEVEAFEQAFARLCGVKYAIATSSGTTALQVALLAHSIGPGDEVITSPFTFIASANAVLYVGATPVFVDIDPVTFSIRPDLLEGAITPRTRAVLPVHLYGLPADMGAIVELADRYRLAVIEDACQAHGATYHGKPVGSFGTGCFSFYPTKNITSGEGGMVTTDDPQLAEVCRRLRQHGTRERYHHDVLGYNFRMTDVHAAIGLAQIKRLSKLNKARAENARYLTQHLRRVILPTVPAGYDHVFHQYTVRVSAERRDAVVAGLLERGIGAAVYYPVPIHEQRLYRTMGYRARLPAAEQAAREVLSLPVHPGLDTVDLELIADTVNALVR